MVEETSVKDDEDPNNGTDDGVDEQPSVVALSANLKRTIDNSKLPLIIKNREGREHVKFVPPGPGEIIAVHEPKIYTTHYVNEKGKR